MLALLLVSKRYMLTVYHRYIIASHTIIKRRTKFLKLFLNVHVLLFWSIRTYRNLIRILQRQIIGVHILIEIINIIFCYIYITT